MVTAAPIPGSEPLAIVGGVILIGGLTLRRRIAKKW
ncbi:MAG: PEP-CTERM sorting domain-containing protein [Planctomycetia bacterium]|nr:PEP-CTERM sorting domain-containing protein [Planctomycetia bacterium]